MKLYLIGHALDYETEKVVKQFLPDEPIERLHAEPSEDENRVVTRLEARADGLTLSCDAFLDGAQARREAHLPADAAEDRKSTRLNSSHTDSSRMPSSA